jgi:tetratricopeptide (TPR) repeat protein
MPVRVALALVALVAAPLLAGCASSKPSHAVASAAAAGAREPAAPDARLARADALLDEAERLRAQAEYPASRAAFEEALSLREQALPAGDPAIAEARVFLGRLENDAGRYDVAEELLRQGLAALDGVEGASPNTLGTAYNGLGFSYDHRQRYV